MNGESWKRGSGELGGRVDVGTVSLERGIASFQYDRSFSGSGIEVAPLMMPLSEQVYYFPLLPQNTFHGLPGLLADSLPDRFGNALIDAWLMGQGRLPACFDAIERICYTGSRGMGALEFLPAAGPVPTVKAKIEIAALVQLASDILSRREELRGSFGDEGTPGL